MFKGEVEVTEKIDGSQFVFGMDEEGKFVCRSKGQLIDMEHPGMFALAVEQAKRIFSESIYTGCSNLYFHTEFLMKPKHNKLCYNRVPLNNLYLFAMWNYNYWEKIDIVIACAKDMKIEPPNVIATAKEMSVASIEIALNTFFELDSILGGCKIEGVVFKNYTQVNRNNDIACCKAVRPEFQEIMKQRSKSINKDAKLEDFLNSFKTEARWDKAIQHLRDKGLLADTPKDIGMVIAETLRDLEEEYGVMIKDFLYKHFMRKINQRTIKGLPEYYIKKLGEK
jgi:hypothetical protein